MSDVYKTIIAIAGELAQSGIAKNRNNQQQGYKFRGIDDVLNELAPLLAKHGLCILPRVLNRTCVERQTAKGGVIFYVTVEVEFVFVAASDGSSHVVKMFGEAMDSADKATNKSMSAAYKYAAFQAFCIPTEGDNDADSQTHEVRPKQQELATPEQCQKLRTMIMDYCLGDQEEAEKTLSEHSKGALSWNKLETAPEAWVARLIDKIAVLVKGEQS